MERIKNINEVTVRGDQLWCEVVRKEKKSLIIKPQETGKDNVDYFIVVSKGKDITDVEAGDIILDVSIPNLIIYTYKGKEYSRLTRNFCDIIIKKENFTIEV